MMKCNIPKPSHFKTILADYDLYQSLASVDGSAYPDEPSYWVSSYANISNMKKDYDNGCKDACTLLNKHLYNKYKSTQKQYNANNRLNI